MTSTGVLIGTVVAGSIGSLIPPPEYAPAVNTFFLVLLAVITGWNKRRDREQRERLRKELRDVKRKVGANQRASDRETETP